ncbi:MAG TPA: hypothetical protein VHJ69_04195 [Gemmatimonadales bacterium]|jgi:hypothetical protein|nr:hypothetical protein [Gemmatimonadales bacterium]
MILLEEVQMQPHVLHFPLPDPLPQPQPVPHPAAPPVPASGSPLPVPTIHVAPTWAYRHLQRPLGEVAELSESELDALGAEGWELAGVTTDGSTAHFFFKRLRW